MTKAKLHRSIRIEQYDHTDVCAGYVENCDGSIAFEVRQDDNIVWLGDSAARLLAQFMLEECPE